MYVIHILYVILYSIFNLEFDNFIKLIVCDLQMIIGKKIKKKSTILFSPKNILKNVIF